MNVSSVFNIGTDDFSKSFVQIRILKIILNVLTNLSHKQIHSHTHHRHMHHATVFSHMHSVTSISEYHIYKFPFFLFRTSK